MDFNTGADFHSMLYIYITWDAVTDCNSCQSYNTSVNFLRQYRYRHIGTEKWTTLYIQVYKLIPLDQYNSLEKLSDFESDMTANKTL